MTAEAGEREGCGWKLLTRVLPAVVLVVAFMEADRRLAGWIAVHPIVAFVCRMSALAFTVLVARFGLPAITRAATRPFSP